MRKQKVLFILRVTQNMIKVQLLKTLGKFETTYWYKNGHRAEMDLQR